MVWRALFKGLILPPAFQILLLFGAWYYWRRRPGLARLLAAVAIASLWLLSTPWVATGLMRSLEDFPAIEGESLIGARVQAIVVLGGGRRAGAPEYGGADTVSTSTLLRLRYGAKLARDTGLPLLVSGGRVFDFEPSSEADLMAHSLAEDFSVPTRWREDRSRTTRENARYSAPMLKAGGIGRIALVSQAWHLPRAVVEFEAQGLLVVPAPTAFAASLAGKPWVMRLMPEVSALAMSRAALHEWLGRGVYALRR